MKHNYHHPRIQELIHIYVNTSDTVGAVLLVSVHGMVMDAMYKIIT